MESTKPLAKCKLQSSASDRALPAGTSSADKVASFQGIGSEAMEGVVVLLNCFVSPFGNRVRIALKLKGVAYEEKAENLAAKSPLLLSSNPVHAQVPVLIVDGKPVCQSLVILDFIDDAFSAAGKPLLPADPYARAHARFWASYVDTKVVARPSIDR